MPVQRITRHFDLEESDNIILVYGQVNDIFVTGDLALYKTDGIEKLLWHYLHDNGYEQVIFFSPGRRLYVYDEKSFFHCIPDQEPSPQHVGTDFNPPSGSNNRPLGAKRYLKRNTSTGRSTQQADSNTNLNQPVWHKNGYIHVVRRGGDEAIVDIIEATLSEQKRMTAVIFSQFDSTGRESEIQRNILPRIGHFMRNTTDNKFILITNAVNAEKLGEVMDNIPSLSQIITNDNAEKGLDSIIYIDYPCKDEIRGLIHYQRIMKGKSVTWLQLEKIVNGLDSQRNQLKKWEKDFRKIEAFDIVSINKALPRISISDGDTSAWKKLDDLIGLEKVKNGLKRYFLHIRTLREKDSKEIPLMHIVLKGNPGTGKTTLAHIIAEIFREEGLLERGHLIEADRARLVAGYIGQTAINTDRWCREALDGVLFIDEAYSLAPRDSTNNAGTQDFGKEAVDTLIKRMSDWQDRLVVILAGYPDEMDHLLKSNPGFKGRIGFYLEIEDYKPAELTQIFKISVSRSNKAIQPELEESITHIFTNIYKKNRVRFDNARTVKQIFDEISGMHEHRCASEGLNAKETPIGIEDVPSEYRKKGWDKKETADGTALERLNNMVGLAKAKEQILRQVALIQAEKDNPGYSAGRRLHLIFKGNPGTGKTSVARIVGEIYQDQQILKNNNFVEVSRSELIAEFQGGTAKRVEEKCREAMGGILFIDEVYSLVTGENDTYGNEAVSTLLRIMENERENLCVIVAGYSNKMNEFMESNPGLRSRFGGEIEFEDYNAGQLEVIFNKKIKDKNLNLGEGVSESISSIIHSMERKKDDNFGNARDLEQMLQKIQESHAFRCYSNNLKTSEQPILEIDLPDEYRARGHGNSPEEQLEMAMQELNDLVGLKSVKGFIEDLVTEFKYEQEALKRNPRLTLPQKNYHLTFEGNPGTGKTTVARLMGKIFKALEILKKGDVIETDRTHFVAGFIGQTAEKTRKRIRNSFENILFIDEAYSLNQGMQDSFGSEAVDVLTKMMEDYRDRFVVIAAGYPRDMRSFLMTNQGLSSRFARRIHFEDYDMDELVQIFKYQVEKRNITISDDLISHVRIQMNLLKQKHKIDFGNARSVEKFLENEILPKYRRRTLVLLDDDELFWTLTKEDFPEIEDNIEPTVKLEKKQRFSPENDREEREQKAGSINHAGLGDIVMGNKPININLEQSKIPKFLTTMPTLTRKRIVGRDEEISLVFDQMMSPTKPDKVVIHGVGGIGKTMLLAQILSDYQDAFEHIVWLEHSISLKKTFIENPDLTKLPKIDIREQDDDEKRYQKIIAALHRLDKTCLIIVDNLPNSDQESLKKLPLGPKIKVLVSSRETIEDNANITNIALEPLKQAAAFELFETFYTEPFDKKYLNVLLEPVSFHPLAVEVMAKVLMRNRRRGFEEMTKLIQERGLHFRQGKINLDYKLNLDEDAEIIEIFKSILNIDELPFPEKQIMRYFSVLPAYPIQIEKLESLFNIDGGADEFQNILDDLVSKGLLVSDKIRGYFCHQLLKQVCQDELKPDAENILPLFKNLGIGLGIKIDKAIASKGIFPLIGEYLSILENFVTYFKGNLDLVKHRVLINLSVLYRVNGQFDKSVEISKQELTSLEEDKSDNPVLYNIVNRNIAFANTQSGNHEEAEKYYQVGLKFLDSLSELKEHPQREYIEQEMILSYSQLGISRLRPEVYDIQSALNYFKKGFEIASNAVQKNHLAMASLHEGMGLALIEESNFDEAVENLKKAKEILISEVGISHDSLPVALIEASLALAWAGKNQLVIADDMCANALEKIKYHLPPDSIEYSRVYTISSVIRIKAVLDEIESPDDLQNLDENKIVSLERSSKLLQKSIKNLIPYRGENHKDLAMLYSTLGLIYKACKKDDLGYEYQMKGVRIYENETHKNVLIAAMYFRTVLFFEDRLSYDDGKKYLDKCIESIPEDLPDYELGISFFNYCIGQYALQHNSDLRDAADYIHKALSGLRSQTLNTNEKDSPMEVLCLQDLAQIQFELGEYHNSIRSQEEAVEICVNHKEEMGDEIGTPFAKLASIYRRHAEISGDFLFDAKALEFKIKAQKHSREIVHEMKELQSCGQLHLVKSKADADKVVFNLMVIPEQHVQRLSIDIRQNITLDPKSYGYVLLTDNSHKSIIKKIDEYTEKYGNLEERFV